jgi:hypothetical protein
MHRDIKPFLPYQVFLNYPFDKTFLPLADAMSFAVIAGGLLPVCALDLSSPDRPRLDMLIEAIQYCHYSAHDLSRSTGEGKNNFSRMNMPLEMGMALFHALVSQRGDHRCIFFVPTPHEYKTFVSDLSGLDPKCHQRDEMLLVTAMYEWLRSTVPSNIFNSRPSIDVIGKFREYRQQLKKVKGTNGAGRPSHEERRELMYRVCTECRWWDWRKTRAGKAQFPIIPIRKL